MACGLFFARVLVELDVTKKYSDFMWIGFETLGFRQCVELEEFPTYCDHCKVLGHSNVECCVLNPSLANNSLPCKDGVGKDVDGNNSLVDPVVVGMSGNSIEGDVIVEPSVLVNNVAAAELRGSVVEDVQCNEYQLETLVVGNHSILINLAEVHDDVVFNSGSGFKTSGLCSPAAAGDGGEASLGSGALVPDNLVDVPIDVMSPTGFHNLVVSNLGVTCSGNSVWIEGYPLSGEGEGDLEVDYIDLDMYGLDVCKVTEKALSHGKKRCRRKSRSSMVAFFYEAWGSSVANAWFYVFNWTMMKGVIIDPFPNPCQWHNSLLREVYGNSFEVPIKHPGKAWKILQDGWNALKDVIRWRVYDGKKISILNDVWILDKSLANWPTFFDISIDEKVKVLFLLADGVWRVETILKLFGPCLADLILQIQTFSDIGEDKPALISTTLSKSISSQAFMARFKTQDDRFDWIYKVKLLPRERLFWWRVIHNAIPTQEWLVSKQLGDSEECIWGCMNKEDVYHILFHCKFSLQVFKTLEDWGFPMPSYHKHVVEDSERTLIFSNPDILFLKSVYQIWMNRNRRKHGGSWWSPAMVASSVLGSFNLINLSLMWKQWGTTRLYPIGISWCPPPSNWLKVNIDGACRNNYKAGIGVMVRDYLGKVLVAAGKSLLHWDVAFIELQSIGLLRQVLNEEMLGASGVIIEGDNQASLNWLKKNIELGRWRYNNLDFDVSFIRDFHHVIINFMPRRFNRAADFCAMHAIDSSFYWRKEDDFSSLLDFVNILKEDAFKPP
ncbi:hypothetical protein M5K25_024632 [Dendrobium thyrsiflorum]|uniref:RNase H type-1 domain-containing protein n=1 Tax=Dendrobium thyrsiflorum TaxID=117978 RepID=A0ABD0U2M5_DENTH